MLCTGIERTGTNPIAQYPAKGPLAITPSDDDAGNLHRFSSVCLLFPSSIPFFALPLSSMLTSNL